MNARSNRERDRRRDMSRVRTIRTTEELFLPDDELRQVLGLHDGDLILEIKRARGGYGEAQQRLDLPGFIVTVLRGVKK